MVDMKKTVVYEDDDILVIDKPAGLVVEKEESARKFDLDQVTLVDILKKDFSIDLPRGGIVHRLDRDTSGLMVVAKNEASLVSLQNQFASHLVEKKYLTLVVGELSPRNGTINIALKRDEKNRTRFVASKARDARSAITHYAVEDYLEVEGERCSLVAVTLETGRTHQIRAHFMAIGFPVVGDSVYTNKKSENLSQKLGLNRQFLHASRLVFTHPVTGKKMIFESDLPKELERIIKVRG